MPSEKKTRLSRGCQGPSFFLFATTSTVICKARGKYEDKAKQAQKYTMEATFLSLLIIYGRLRAFTGKLPLYSLRLNSRQFDV